jgi:lysophospholipase L1-like esterase
MKRRWRGLKRVLVTLSLCSIWVAIGAVGASAGTSAGAGAATPTAKPTNAATLAPGDRYVSIGSSIASGDGIPVQTGGDCDRSSNDYAQILTETLQLNLQDVSCTAAVIPDVLNKMLDGNLPQIAFVTKKTKLITVGIGGNDIEYNMFADECGLVGQCTPPDNLAALEAALPNRLNKMLAALKAKAPQATIVLVTYPQEFPAENCAALGIPDSALADLQQIETVLENDLVAAAQSAHVLLADPYAAGMGDHTGCADASMQWTSPLAAVNSFPYHPTALGHEVMAGEILNALGYTLPTPSTTLIEPVDGATVHGRQDLDANASAGVTQVRFELTGGTLDDQIIATASPTVYGWLVSWKSRTVPNGTYTLQSVATDNVGSTAVSPSITITINNATSVATG